jgi:hypothetical protein
MSFASRSMFLILQRIIEHTVKSHDMGLTALLPPPKEGMCAVDYYRP